MPDGVEKRPKLPRNAPIGPIRKRTFSEPIGNIVIESAPFAHSTSRRIAQVGKLGATEMRLLVAPDRVGVYEPPREVSARCMGAPNAESAAPIELIIKNVAARLRIPLDYAPQKITSRDIPLLRPKSAGEVTRTFREC